MEWGADEPRSSPTWQACLTGRWTWAPRGSARADGTEAPVAGGDEGLERRPGRGVDCAIDALGTEMALKGGHHIPRRGVDLAGDGDAVAVFRQQLLHLRDARVAVTERERRSGLLDGSGLDPQADAGIGQQPPGKFFARVALA